VDGGVGDVVRWAVGGRGRVGTAVRQRVRGGRPGFRGTVRPLRPLDVVVRQSSRSQRHCGVVWRGVVAVVVVVVLWRRSVAMVLRRRVAEVLLRCCAAVVLRWRRVAVH